MNTLAEAKAIAQKYEIDDIKMASIYYTSGAPVSSYMEVLYMKQEEAVSLLSKAKVIKDLIISGLKPKDAVRVLGQRMRVFGQ